MSSLVQLVTRNRSWSKASNTNPSVGEIKSEKALGVTQGLWRSDWVAQILDDVKDLSDFCRSDGLHLAFEIFVALIQAVSLWLIRFAQHQHALTITRLVQFNQGLKDWEPDANEPALACTSIHSFKIESLKEIDFDQHDQVVKEPVE